MGVDPAAESAGLQDELLGAAFDLSPHGISVVSLDGRWLEINDAYCRMLGYERAELIGASFCEFTHPDDVAEDREFLTAAIAGDVVSSDREKRYVRKDNSVLWARVQAQLVRDEAGEPRYFVSHVQDVAERRAAQEMQRESERTLRSVIDNTPAMISVKGRDHRYKLVNREFAQVFGVAGDWIVGRSDAEIVPASSISEVHVKDLLVLDGGQTVQEEETIVLGGRERVVLRTRFPLRGEDGEIHAVCEASTDITDRRLEERSKRARLQCSEMVYSALAQNRFVLHGQPIIELASGQPVNFELLIRMRTAVGGTELLSPAEFLPAAERFDLIHVIDDWVIDRAIELAVAGHGVTVNVSAKTISDPAHVNRIEEGVVASGASAANLVFEITETAVADNLDAARTFATRLRQHGCAIALDDFGVGHGTFTYLRHLPVDYLKIDMQFVRNLLNDAEDRQIVMAIVSVARQFKIRTIAEGVEDQATLEELRRIGADYVQGYWTGRPASLPNAWMHPKSRRGDTRATHSQ